MKSKCSTIVAFGVLLLFLGSYLFPSLRMTGSENRTMATFDMVVHPQKDSVVYHDSPVERAEAALSDQFAFREAAVKQYLRIFNKVEDLTVGLIKLFLRREAQQYALHPVGNYALIEDTGYITLQPGAVPMDAGLVQRHVDQIERLHQAFPELKLYVYYVTQAYDTAWFDGYIGARSADNYAQIVSVLPAYVMSGHLVYEDLADYMDIHYRTDHHWNHKGARRGYEDLVSLLGADFDMGTALMPTSENRVSETYDFVYLGSYGRALGELYAGGYDDFFFYEYDLPSRELAVLDPETREEKNVSRMGLYEEYRQGQIDRTVGADHYIAMYGTARDDAGTGYADGAFPFIIRNAGGNGKNLLIVGDSYNRALREALSAHFDTTVYMDYRTLSKLPVDYVIDRYGVDALLISSHISMWNEEAYFFTFEGDG